MGAAQRHGQAVAPRIRDPRPATRDPRGGWRTQVRRFDAANLDEAREAIVTDIRNEKASSWLAGGLMDNLGRMAGQRHGK